MNVDATAARMQYTNNPLFGGLRGLMVFHIAIRSPTSTLQTLRPVRYRMAWKVSPRGPSTNGGARPRG